MTAQKKRRISNKTICMPKHATFYLLLPRKCRFCPPAFLYSCTLKSHVNIKSLHELQSCKIPGLTFTQYESHKNHENMTRVPVNVSVMEIVLSKDFAMPKSAGQSVLLSKTLRPSCYNPRVKMNTKDCRTAISSNATC